MPRFKYKARDINGSMISAVAEADNVALLKNSLRERGIWVTEVKPETRFHFFSTRGGSERISGVELTMYSRQMGVLLESGISLTNALDSLQESASPRLKPVLQKIADDVKSGKTYASALRQFPRIFSPFYIGMIEVGEAGGLLSEMHQRLTSHLEQGMDLKRKVMFASIYPLIVFSATIFGVCVILIYAFPKIADIYKRNKVPLPLLTQIMIGVSDFLIHQWYVPLSLIILLLVLIFIVRIQDRPPVRQKLDQLVLSLPVYSKFLQQIAIARFTHNISLLLNGGLPLLKSLVIVKTLLDNFVIQGFIDRLIVSVEHGEGLTAYLRENRFFPPLLVSMVKTGEQSGALSEMMLKASVFYDREVDDGVRKFTALLEPVLIIFAAVMVFLVLLAFYLPMFGMMKAMNIHH